MDGALYKILQDGVVPATNERILLMDKMHKNPMGGGTPLTARKAVAV